jgi:CelD/BcsL family acetyltransferase involved in cellulose biosynthesis
LLWQFKPKYDRSRRWSIAAVVQVLEINCLEELASYRLVWHKLLGQTRRASFFQSLDWLEPYLRHYGAEQKLRILIVSGSEGHLGILPLVVQRQQTKVGQVRVLTYPLDEWGTFYGPIGPYPAATLLAGLSHLERGGRDWDLLELRWVNRDAVDFGRTAHALQALEMSAAQRSAAAVAMVEMDGDWQAYWNTRDTRFRKNIDRSRRKLAERGRVEYVRYRPAGIARGDADPRWDLYNTCEQLAAASWQGSSQTGNTLSHASVCDYLRDAHVAAVDAGAADINLLYVDGRPAAFAYCYHFQGQVSGLRMGYDSSAAHEGAGSALTAHMLEDSFRRGDRLFDLGAGYLDIKRHWLTALETPYTYTHFAPVAKAQALRAGRWARRYWQGIAG